MQTDHENLCSHQQGRRWELIYGIAVFYFQALPVEQFGGGVVSYVNVIKLRTISFKIPLAVFYSG